MTMIDGIVRHAVVPSRGPAPAAVRVLVHPGVLVPPGMMVHRGAIEPRLHAGHAPAGTRHHERKRRDDAEELVQEASHDDPTIIPC